MTDSPKKVNLSLSFAMLFCASLHHVKERGSNRCWNVWVTVFPAALSPFGIAKVRHLFQLRNTCIENNFNEIRNYLKTRERESK